MPIKTIAVGLMTAPEAEWLVPAACALAETWDAHLIGVHPVEPFVPYSGADMGVPDLVGPMFLEWQMEETAAIKKTFDHFTRLEDFVSGWREQDVTMIGAGDFLLNHLRAADLVVMGQVDPETGQRDQTRLQEQAIRESGRPVLVLPRGKTEFGVVRHLLIGWSNTREATRAAHEALALLSPGAAVDILFVGPEGNSTHGETVLRQDLAAALDRHGYKVNMITRPKAGSGTGDVLMEVAFEQGADLIASGAFGHSRAYDFVIGAVTRDLLEKAKVPVLFSK
ncbi:universal stress protein [Pseudogemmobacter sp. W21_MBD1_M6]|uniref:universal stress protein n=1 Tax=Pseudogemmobacter sp. W21_MBD1_M6 TaxID=3240271 RepID=UPI003F9B993D